MNHSSRRIVAVVWNGLSRVATVRRPIACCYSAVLPPISPCLLVLLHYLRLPVALRILPRQRRGKFLLTAPEITSTISPPRKPKPLENEGFLRYETGRRASTGSTAAQSHCPGWSDVPTQG